MAADYGSHLLPAMEAHAKRSFSAASGNPEYNFSDNLRTLTKYEVMLRKFKQNTAEKNSFKSIGLFRPDHRSAKFWEAFVFLLVLWQAISTPFQFGFMSRFRRPITLATIDYFTDFVFLIDICRRALFLAFREGRNYVFEQNVITKHYFSSTAAITDILASVPFEIPLLLWSPSDSSMLTLYQLRMLLRLPKLFRLVGLLISFSIN